MCGLASCCKRATAHASACMVIDFGNSMGDAQYALVYPTFMLAGYSTHTCIFSSCSSPGDIPRRACQPVYRYQSSCKVETTTATRYKPCDRAVMASRSRVVGQGLCEDVGPGHAGEAAHGPACCKLLPAVCGLRACVAVGESQPPAMYPKFLSHHNLPGVVGTARGRHILGSLLSDLTAHVPRHGCYRITYNKEIGQETIIHTAASTQSRRPLGG